MKADIPNGWARLRSGTRILRTDRMALASGGRIVWTNVARTPNTVQPGELIIRREEKP